MSDLSIMYAMICTQPDMSYAIIVMSIYQSDQYDDHLDNSKNILTSTKDIF